MEINKKHRSRLIEFTIDHCAEPAFWIGPEADFIYVNQAACTLLGYTRRELLGLTIHDIDLELPGEVWPAYWASLRKRRNDVLETRLRAKGGRIFPAEIKANFIEFEGSEYNCTFVHDISDRKSSEDERVRLETQMREVQKLESLGVLAGGIAHDFNNLLMAILGNADLALFSLAPHAPARHNVEEIAVASKRAADLCRQMLAYSGKSQLIVKPQDLSAIIGEMPQMLDAAVPKKAVLRYEFTPDLPAVMVDESQIQQVIINLVTNATEALEDQKGDIIIATGQCRCNSEDFAQSVLNDNLPAGHYVYLEVRDTGKGMDPQTCTKIFDPFYTTKFVGRGLGLASVLGIVRGHKGAIRVNSRPGQGTTIRVLLPAVRQHEESRNTAPAGNGAGNPKGAILLIDDDPSVRQVGAEMLKLLGFTVMTAPDGRHGIDLFRGNTENIDLVVLDLTMPELDGSETYRALRQISNEIRIILSSGYNEKEATQHLKGSDLAGYIQKPYTVSKLRKTLSRALA